LEVLLDNNTIASNNQQSDLSTVSCLRFVVTTEQGNPDGNRREGPVRLSTTQQTKHAQVLQAWSAVTGRPHAIKRIGEGFLSCICVFLVIAVHVYVYCVGLQA